MVAAIPGVHVAGHQLQPCVGVGGARTVLQRHPAGKVDARVLLVELCYIVGFPAQAAAEVAQLQQVSAAPCHLQAGDQGGLVAKGCGDVLEEETATRVGFDAVTDAHHQAVLGAEHGGRLPCLDAGGRIGAQDADLASQVLLQQLSRSEQVVVEVLFQHADATGAVTTLEQGGFRLQPAAHAADGQLLFASGQLHPAPVADQGQVGVVDGE